MEEPGSDAPASVQHVDRKRSDQLLSKFADETKDPRAPKRRRRGPSSPGGGGVEPNGSRASGERRSLLAAPPAEAAAKKRRSALLRKLGVVKRPRLGARDVRSRSLLGAIEKTWRRTVEGASRAFVEKHYHRHERLISDAV